MLLSQSRRAFHWLFCRPFLLGGKLHETITAWLPLHGCPILAKISFNIILLNLAVRIIANFLLIDLFVFNLWWWMFDRYISINDRKLSNTNEYLINRFASIVWKNSIVRQISITKIVMVAPQRASRPLRDDVIE